MKKKKKKKKKKRLAKKSILLTKKLSNLVWQTIIGEIGWFILVNLTVNPAKL